MEAPDRGDVPNVRTFLIADVRGYTRFTQERGDAQAARLAKRFADLARDAVVARGGRVIELRGDEALAVFTSTPQAVRAALEFQATCAEETAADPTLPLTVGIGIDAGEAIPVEDGFRGAALNTAARLCSRAAAGQVLVTRAVAEVASAENDVLFKELGAADLKGFDTAVDVIEARPSRPPVLRLTAARDATVLLPPELDVQTPLVDREPEMHWLRGTWRHARRGYGRIVFVTGPSQIGKTRLIAEVASQIAAAGDRVRYAGPGGAAAAMAMGAVREAVEAVDPTLTVLDDLDVAGADAAQALLEASESIRMRPVLVIGLVKDPHASSELWAVIEGADARGDGHIRLAPLDLKGVEGITRLYVGDDVQDVPLESLARASGGLPGRVHEVVSEWARDEAGRRLAAAAQWLAEGSGRRSADLEFANNIIKLRLGRLYAGDGEGVGDVAAESPYKGLASFDENDSAYFFGRERLVGELAARSVGMGMLGVLGASGSGKSSAVAAGLLRSLRAGLLPGSERWTCVLFRPGEHPMAELRAAAALDGSDDAGSEGRLVVVIDQFEEIFTLCNDDGERDEFVAAITEAAKRPDRVVFVATIRDDFYGRCAPHRELADLLSASHVLVPPMTRDELRRAIELPARRVGLRVEGALVDALVKEVADEPGGLPLLSAALVELWQAREDGWLRMSAYERTGGVRGAVARLAEASYQQLNDAEQGVARRILLRLAIVGDGDETRRRAHISEFDVDTDADAARVLALLTRDRLLTMSDSTVEVAHEALLREWPRLRGWLEEDVQGQRLHQHVTIAAKQWDETGRDASELYRGARLSAALDWSATRGADLNELEREFLAQSRQAGERDAERQRRANRRLRGLLVGTAIFLVLALVAGGFALVQRGAAQDRARIALAQRLGAQAVSEPRIDRAMLLAREAVNLDRSAQTEGTLLSTLLRSPAAVGTFTMPIEIRPRFLAVSPDGTTLVVSDNHQELRFFDTRTRRESRPPLATIAGLESIGELAPVRYSPDGSRLVALGTAKRSGETVEVLQVLDAQTLKPVRSLFHGPDYEISPMGLQAFGVSPNNANAFQVYDADCGCFDATPGPALLDRWDVATGKRTTIRLGSVGKLAAALTDRGRRLVTVTRTEIAFWDAETLRRIRSVRQPVESALGASISPDGRTVAVGSVFGSVDFVNTATGDVTRGVGGHGTTGPLSRGGYLWSPDGRVFVSTGQDAKVIVWDPATGRQIETLLGHGGPVFGAAFTAAGDTLYTAGQDGVIFEWDLGTTRRFGRPFRAVSASAPELPFILAVGPPLAIAPDSARFAVRIAPTTVGLVSMGTLQIERSFPAVGADSTVTAVEWSAEEGALVVGGTAGEVRIWDVRAEPRLQRSLEGLPSAIQVESVAVSPDGNLIAAGGATPEEIPVGDLAVWDRGAGTPKWKLHFNRFGDVLSLAFSPDGKLLAAPLGDGRVLLLDAATGRIERTLKPVGTFVVGIYPTPVSSVVFTGDRSLLTGTFSGIVQHWSVDGTPIGEPVLVSSSGVSGLSLARGGARFVTAGIDGAVKLWSTMSLQQFGSDFPRGAGSANARYAPDGKTLVVVYDDGTGVTWPVAPAAWEEHACDVAGRNFTREEWRRYVTGRSFGTVCSGISR